MSTSRSTKRIKARHARTFRQKRLAARAERVASYGPRPATKGGMIEHARYVAARKAITDFRETMRRGDYKATERAIIAATIERERAVLSDADR